MAVVKVMITLEKDLLQKLDALVKRKVFISRSKGIQEALEDKLAHIKPKQTRLAIECAKLKPNAEQAIAEEGMAKHG